MSTFNHLAGDNTAGKMATLASLGIVLPKCSKHDKRRTKQFRKCIMNAAKMGDIGLPNAERIETLGRAIAKFSKLNAGVLDGGLPLKTALIECAWIAYAKLEDHGIDSAHWMVTNIPCDDRQTERAKRGIGLTYHGREIKRDMPDSKLEGFAQWTALYLADLFGPRHTDPRPEPKQSLDTAPFIGPVKPLRPISQISPFKALTFKAEKPTGGKGSGLPFEPKTVECEPEPEREVKRWYGGNRDWFEHPKALETRNSQEAITDNLKWLASIRK